MTERVDFYILKSSTPKQRWTFACRLTEKAYLREGPTYAHKVLWVYRHRGYPYAVIAQFDVWRRVRAADHAGYQVARPDRRVRGGLEDPAEGLVPDYQPRLAGRWLPAAPQDLRVGPADAGQQPLDQDLAVSGRGIGQLRDQRRAGAARDHAHRLHGSELIQPGPSGG